MPEDGWKNYQQFKTSCALSERYYDLVRTVFIAGVRRACEAQRVERALDLGCGGGELTQELLAVAERVTGVDASPGLISQASANSARENLEFILANVLDDSALSLLPEGGFDLITAAWLHNHLGSEDQQHKLRDSILRLLKPNGRVVFLIPGLGFTTPQAQQLFRQLNWHQAWFGHTDCHTHGIYRFADSLWQEMWVWQPMWLARLYHRHFRLEFQDMKCACLEHDGLGPIPLEPPFEILVGWRREQTAHL